MENGLEVTAREQSFLATMTDIREYNPGRNQEYGVGDKNYSCDPCDGCGADACSSCDACVCD